MIGEKKIVAWLAFGAAIVVLASPVKLLWARTSFGWTGTFGVWLLLIAASAWINRNRGP
jgi:hypothetical protein